MKKKFIYIICLSALPVCLIAQNSSPYWSLAGNSNATSSSKLGSTTSIPLRLITNNIERVRITSGGNVGIGTSTPATKLHVNSGSGLSAFRAQVNGSTKLLVHSGGGVSVGSGSTPPSNGLYVAGNVGIGTSTPSYKLHVVGNAEITGGLSVTQNGISAYNYSSSGIGVYGYSSYIGAYGYGGSYGLYGVGSGTSSFGVYASGKTGVYGFSTLGGGDGVHGFAYGASGYGVYGYSSSSLGVYGSTGSSSSYAGFFSGNVYSTGSYLGSDRTLKQNISDLTSAMDIINKLHPKSYNFRQDGNYKLMNLPAGKHYGLIAQDVEQILPDLVKGTKFESHMAPPVKETASMTTKPDVTASSTSIEFKALNYTELIPIIIKAMQEQQATIEKQNIKIEALTQLVNQLKGSGPEALVKLSGISLNQNVPNPPVTNHTRINYNIPSGTTAAELVFTNAAGQKIKQISLNDSGLIDIDTSTLSAGTYFYTLYVNGKSFDTKKMIINR